MKRNLVQLLNPISRCYTLVDTTRGRILKHHPKKNTPYKNVEIKWNGLKRTPLKRSTKPICKVSKKQAKIKRELNKIQPPADGKCEQCGNLPDFRGLAKHHIIFKSHCGSNNRSNLRWLCGKCHSLKHGIKEV